MSDRDTDQTAPDRRKPFLIAGSVLWLLVLIALYGVWNSWTNREPASQQPAGQILVLDSGNGDEDASNNAAGSGEHIEDADDSSDSETGTPGAGNTTTPVWDPDGIANFELIERSGRKVTKADLLGHPWAVCFVFTRCAGPCPRMTGQMRILQDQFEATDVRFVTITVDPEYDTPERLEHYADTFGADPERWLFLTGEQDAIYRLIGGSFKMPVVEMQGEDRKPGFEVLHSTNILHVNARGVVVGKYDGRDEADMVRLRRALEEAVSRAAR